MNTDFSYLRSAIREGLQKMIPTKSKIDSISLYEGLKPSDFALLEKKYGSQTVTDYIKAMEIERMRKAGNNGK